jgi:cytochrome b involved in lipid metabolism
LAPYQATVNVDPTNQKVHLEISWGQQGGNAVANQTPQASAPPSKPEEKKAAPVEQKEYTLDEVAKHNTEQDCWGKVFLINIFLFLLNLN